MRAFRALALCGTIVAYALAFLGSWTRINAAGMTCPDWPLCRGAIVPALHGGVVLEWSHRLTAALETAVVAAVIVAGLRLRTKIPALGFLLFALGGIFALQVGLGGATIFLANSPLSVMLHWGTAMLLIAVLCTLTIVAFSYSERSGESAPRFGGRGTAPLIAAAVCAFATMCAGAFVSSSGAGLACPSFPDCGPALLGQTVPQALQMTHRLLAGTLVVFAILALLSLPRGYYAAAVTLRIALGLLALQIVLGSLVVVWQMPTALRAAHAANAVATFLAFTIAAVLASLAAGSLPQASSIPAGVLTESA